MLYYSLEDRSYSVTCTVWHVGKAGRDRGRALWINLESEAPLIS